MSRLQMEVQIIKFSAGQMKVDLQGFFEVPCFHFSRYRSECWWVGGHVRL